MAIYLYWLNIREFKVTKLKILKEEVEKIKIALNEFNELRNFKRGYFSHFDATEWLKKNDALLNHCKSYVAFYSVGLPSDFKSIFKDFVGLSKQVHVLRSSYNKRFIDHEAKEYADFFANLEQHGLDAEQVKAVITNEDNTLVVAGAGSGKTTTMVGKVQYLLERYNIPPEQLLVISFTRFSASTLSKRLEECGVSAQTFHKFGMQVIAQAETQSSSIFDQSQFNSVLKKICNDLLSDPTYLDTLMTYFYQYLRPLRPATDFATKGEYYQYCKEQQFSPFKGRFISDKYEVLKSLEEVQIANFLLANGLDYSYEQPYEHDTATKKYRQYKPDFTVTQGDTTVYIEHFGVNRAGQVPPFFANKTAGETRAEATEKYRQGMQWKRDLHKEYGTTLLETYSYQMSEGTLFDSLRKQFNAVGIQLKPLSAKELWEQLQKTAAADIQKFTELLQTFISLVKSNNASFMALREKNTQTDSAYMRTRNNLFLDLVERVYNEYESYLQSQGEIDFNDMINRATNYIKNGQYTEPCKYILIDEFQDISLGRYQLVQALKNANPSCKLFCVGDDWQSIYRFAGSDMSLFTRFAEYFGVTETVPIQTTYRFAEPLISLSSEFILKNTLQMNKALQSGVAKQTEWRVLQNTASGNDTDAIVKIFAELEKLPNIEEKEIFIVGRYSFDLKRLESVPGVLQVDVRTRRVTYQQNEACLRADFMTAHTAKGLEADIVIVLNCSSGTYGFPSRVSDDPVLNLVLTKADGYEHGEERRLFLRSDDSGERARLFYSR